jgi:hypothetical protein
MAHDKFDVITVKSFEVEHLFKQITSKKIDI